MRFAIFAVHASKVLRLPLARQSDARSYKVLHLSHKIIFPKLKIWCSKMQPFSGNECPDLLTSLMHMSLVLRLPRDMHLSSSSSHAHTCHRFWTCYKTLTFCSLCRSPCACHAKPHLNLQKCSENAALCAFWLRNVLRATTACTFSSSQVVWDRRFLTLLTSKCASRHNGVLFFISHLPRRLRTRLFSEPTLRPSGATNHWKNTVFRFTFSRTCIFCLLTLSLLWSSFFFSSLLWLSPPLLFHLSILSEVWLLIFLDHILPNEP